MSVLHKKMTYNSSMLLRFHPSSLFPLCYTLFHMWHPFSGRNCLLLTSSASIDVEPRLFKQAQNVVQDCLVNISKAFPERDAVFLAVCVTLKPVLQHISNPSALKLLSQMCMLPIPSQMLVFEMCSDKQPFWLTSKFDFILRGRVSLCIYQCSNNGQTVDFANISNRTVCVFRVV